MNKKIIAKKIAQQYEETPFTDFSSITHKTVLESLNLNWRERDLPESLRTKHVHRLHPYMGKFIPQLVEIFLRKYRPTLVYDPFCGSGTTLVEANALGVDSIGTDISIFNCLLSQVKTSKYDLPLLEKEVKDILKKMQTNILNNFKEFPSLATDDEYLNQWFAPQALKELLCYSKLLRNYKYKKVLAIILSRSARSARLVTHYELDFPKIPQKEPYYCYKHRRTCTPVQEAYKFLERYSLDTLKRIKDFSKLHTDAEVRVIHSDSRTVKLPRNIDCIITSPPYLGLIDYHAQHKYAYSLLGLKNNEEKEIGAAKKGNSDQAKDAYVKGIEAVFKNAKKYLSEKGKVIIIVNDKHNLYNAKRMGFKQINRIERHVNRRTGMRSGAFYESILIWEKI